MANINPRQMIQPNSKSFLQVGKNLWNNMVETVDSRSSNYDINQLAIKCPGEGDFISTTQ